MMASRAGLSSGVWTGRISRAANSCISAWVKILPSTYSKQVRPRDHMGS